MHDFTLAFHKTENGLCVEAEKQQTITEEEVIAHLFTFITKMSVETIMDAKDLVNKEVAPDAS